AGEASSGGPHLARGRFRALSASKLACRAGRGLLLFARDRPHSHRAVDSLLRRQLSVGRVLRAAPIFARRGRRAPSLIWTPSPPAAKATARQQQSRGCSLASAAANLTSSEWGLTDAEHMSSHPMRFMCCTSYFHIFRQFIDLFSAYDPGVDAIYQARNRFVFHLNQKLFSI